MPKADFQSMSFGDHLEELRRRLIMALLGIVPILVVCLLFGKQILLFLLDPLEDQLLRAGQAPTLQALSPVETFGAYVKVSTVAAVLLAVPWLLWQLWLFVAPGLYEHERRFARLLLPFSAILTAAGAAFLYYAMLPVALFFLISFGAGVAQRSGTTAPLPEGVSLASVPVLAADPLGASPGSMWVLEPTHQLRIQADADTVWSVALTSGALIAQQYRVKDFVDLIFILGLVFALAFQTPIVVLLLSWVGIVEPADLVKKRRHAFALAAILGAVLTPTGDPASMMLLTIPLYALFELGLALARFLPASRVAGPVPTDGAMDDEP
jgi:sec-independent protein translocase protein TatC